MNFKWIDWATVLSLGITFGKTAASGIIQGLKQSTTTILNVFGKLGTKIADVMTLSTFTKGSKLSFQNTLSSIYTKLPDGTWGQFSPNEQNILNSAAMRYRTQNPVAKNWSGYDLLSYTAGNREQAAKIVKDWADNTQQIRDAFATTAAQSFSIAFTNALITSFNEQDPAEMFFKSFKSSTVTLLATMWVPLGKVIGAKIALGIGEGIVATIGGAVVAGSGLVALAAAISGVFWGIKSLQKWNKERQDEKKKEESAYYAAEKRIEALKEKEEDLENAVQKATQKMNEQQQAYDDLVSNGDKLEKLRNKISLTEEEQQELYDTSNKIAELAPELISQYDNEGNAVIELGNAYKELAEQKRKAYLESKIEADEADIESLLNKTLDEVNVRIKDEDYLSLIRRFLEQEGSGLLGQEQIGEPGVFIYTGLADEIKYAMISEEMAGRFVTIFKDLDILQNKERLKKAKTNVQYLQELQELLAYDSEGEIFEAIQNALQLELPKAEIKTQKPISSVDELQNEINQYIADYAILTIDGFEDLDKNAQKAAIEKIKRQNNIDIQKIIEENGQDTEAMQRAVDQKLHQVPLINFDINEGWKKAYSDYTEKISNGDFNNLVEEERYIKEKFKDFQDDIDLWYKNNASVITAYNETLRKLSEQTGEAIVEGTGNGLSYAINGHSLTAIFQQLGDTAQQNLMAAFEKAQEYGTENIFVSTLEKAAKNLSINDLNKILVMDWDSYTQITAKDMWDALIKSLSDDGKKVAKNPTIQKAFEGLFANLDNSFDSMLEGLEDKADTITKNISAYEKAMKSSIQDGFVDDSALKALRKAGAPLEKLINEDSTLNEEEAKKWLEDQIGSVQDIVEGEKQKLIIKKQELELLKKELEVNRSISRLAYQTALAKAGYLPSEITKEMARWDENEGNISNIIESIANDIEDLDILIKDEDGTLTRYAEALYKALVGAYNASNNEIAETRKKKVKEEEDAAEKIKDANEKVEKAYQDIIDKQDDLLKKQQELQEIYTGTAIDKSSIDHLYNYANALEYYDEKINELNDDLNDLQGKDSSEIIDNIMATEKAQKAYLLAEEDRINQSIINRENVLRNQVKDYLNSLGIDYSIDDILRKTQWGYDVNTSMIPGGTQIREGIESLISELNNEVKQVRETEKKIADIEKQADKRRKELRDKRIEYTNKLIEALKKKYQEEIDNKKAMYDALNEEDDKYLDALSKAIDKQKKLRDKQTKWEELAQKQKKLSLISRDTSGANARDIKQQQKDIEKDRRSMLDDEISDVIDELKDFYETQKEAREEEIEMSQSILDNARLIEEVSRMTVEEQRQLYFETIDDIDKLSAEEIEKLNEEWDQLYGEVVAFNQQSVNEINGFYQVAAEDVQKAIQETSETLTSEAERAFGEMQKNVDEAIKNGEKAVEDAMKALTDAQDAYNESIKELNELIAEQQELSNVYQGHEIEEQDAREILKFEKEAIQYYIKNRPTGIAYDEFMKNWYANSNYNFEDYLRDYVTAYDTPMAEQVMGRKILAELESSSKTKDVYEEYYNYEEYYIIDEFGVVRQTGAYGEEYIDEFGVVGRKKNPYFIGPLPDSKQYDGGGLVNYTGPAWVDGTPQKPEAFLSAEDTVRIGEAATILRDIASFNKGTLSQAISTKVGDTNIEMHFHVDSIATEEQVDYLVDKVKEEIVEVANPIGTPVILR